MYQKSSCLAMALWLIPIPQRFYTEFWHGLALVINITKCKEQRQLQLTVACSWAFLLKLGVTSPFLASITAQNMLPCTFPQANLGKMAVRVVLWPLGLYILYYRNPCTLCLPHEWKYEKMGRFPAYRVLGSHLYFCLVTARSASCQRTIRTVYVPGRDKSL